MRAEEYQPSADVLAKLKHVDFVGLVGPTAAGKSTLIHAAVQAEPERFKEVIVTTSRLPRPGERQGKDMHFRSKAELEAGISSQRFVQVMFHPSGDVYGTTIDEYPTADTTALMPVLASVIPIFRGSPFKRFRLIYVLPPDIGTWLKRIKERCFTAEEQDKRFEEARESLRIALADPGMLYLVSETPEQAVADLRALLDGTYDQDEQIGLRDCAVCFLPQIY